MKDLLQKFYVCTYVFIYVCISSVLSPNLVFAQTPSEDCHVAGAGTPDLNYFGLGVDRSQSDYWIKVYFHIVRKDNGDGGYDATRIPNLINILDEAFNPHKIYFDYECATSYIDDTERVTNGGRVRADLWCEWENIAMPTDGINIFIIANNSGIEANALGIASGIPGNFMVLVSSHISNYNADIESTTIIHEMGHLFGMYHLHHGSNKNPLIWHPGTCDPECPGNVGFINCADFNNPIYDLSSCAETDDNGDICGDYIPDTNPSHPLIEGAVVGCEWDPSTEVVNSDEDKPFPNPLIKDPDGQNYDPDIRNFMSIILAKSCRNYFTPNQVTVMKNHLESHPVLEDVITTPPAITCDCPFQNVINVSGAYTNWSSVVQSNSLHPGTLSDYEIRVDGTLNIDVDYNFSNCKFLFGEDDVLSLGAGKYILFQNTIFNSCDEKWQGISMLSTAYAGFVDCTVKNANIGISSILSSSSTVSLSNNRFMLCNIGLSIRGELNIRAFDNNLFLGGDIGVTATSSTSYLNLSASSLEEANIFNYVNIGIELDRASAYIENNEFHFTERAISLNESFGTKVKNNTIGYRQSGVDVKNSIHVDIWDNTIGSTHQLRGYAVEITSCTHSTVNGNTIESSNLGIRLLGCRDVHIVNNDIQIAANNFKNSGGISASASWNTYIMNQDKISVENGIFGIESLMSGANAIEGNIVELNPQNWLASAAGIRILGTDNSSLYKNEALVKGLSSGINLTNAMHNEIDCNELTAFVALRVGNNSDIQNIQTNVLDGGGYLDLLIRSQIGIQNHTGNFFLGGNAYAEDLSQLEIENSRFFVNSSYTNHLPDIVDPTEWFDDEIGIPITCPGQNPPVFEYFIDSIEVCNYWEHLKDVKQANYASFHIQFLQFKTLVKTQFAGILPTCILSDTIYTQTCGIDDLSDIRSDLLHVNDIPENLMVDIIDYASDIEGLLDSLKSLSPGDSLERLGINSLLTATMINVESVQDSIKDLRLGKLDSIQDACLTISCTDTLTLAWKDIVMITTEHLKGNEIDSSQQDMLKEYSSFCPEIWGDMIYLARSVTMTFDTASYEVNDHCLESLPQLPEMTDTVQSAVYEYTAYPNPGNGTFTFRQPEPRETRLFMTDSYGRTVWQGETDHELSSFSVQVPSGIYLLFIIDGETMNTPIKLVIQ